MAKKGFQHHLCQAHGAEGLVLVETKPAHRHHLEVLCKMCKPTRFINWCSLDQAQKLIGKYGDKISVQQFDETN